jgi:hypothetical protein
MTHPTKTAGRDQDRHRADRKEREVSNDKRAADDAEREAFEAWANERELDLTPGYPGQYSDCNTDFAWGAWQARAALSSRADGGKDSSDARDAERWRMNIRLMRRKHGQREINEVLAVVDAAIAKEKK